MSQPTVAVYLTVLPSMIAWCLVTEAAGTAGFASVAGCVFSAGSVAVSSLLQVVAGTTPSRRITIKPAIAPRIRILQETTQRTDELEDRVSANGGPRTRQPRTRSNSRTVMQTSSSEPKAKIAKRATTLLIVDCTSECRTRLPT